jgi:hypothetical protein
MSGGEQYRQFRQARFQHTVVAAILPNFLRPVGKIRAVDPGLKRAAHAAARTVRDIFVEPLLFRIHFISG